MALLSTQKPSAAGVALTYGAVTASDTFANTGREFLHVKNGSASPVPVTVKSGPTSNNKCSFGIGNAAHDLAVTVGAGLDALIGPLDRDRFNDASTGIATVAFSATATITAAVIASA